MPRTAIALVLTAFLFCACAQEPSVIPEDVERAWQQYREEPNVNTYTGFIHANRKAAMAHPYTDDAQGVMHQVLSLEAQSEHAERTQDLRLADAVLVRVDEIREGGVIDNYEEVFPGAKERLLAARARVEGMLQ